LAFSLIATSKAILFIQFSPSFMAIPFVKVLLALAIPKVLFLFMVALLQQ
jgi:hypothetical protein